MKLGQRIELEGTINTRSLGGYQTEDGLRIKENRFLRSDALCNLTPSDMKYFEDVAKLRLDIDMRGMREVNNFPDKAIPNCFYLHCPIEEDLQKTLPHSYPHEDFHIEDKQINGTVEYLFKLDEHGDARFAFETIYRNFIKNAYSQEHYKIMLKAIADNKEGSVLVHCADGKDRSGVGVAIFLSALGVKRETIIEDYLLTNENTKKKADYREWYLREVAHVTNETVINSVRIVAGVRENFLLAAFDEIDRNFGGIEEYLKNQLDFGKSDQERLRENYLER